jgi:ABC-2 type transport system permease protein
MLRELIRKEMVLHLLSARFQLVVALVVVLMAAGAVMFHGEYSRRLEDFNASEETRITELSERAQAKAPLFQVYSFYDQEVMMRPQALGFISDGHERDLPNLIKINAFRVHEPIVQQRGNAMLPPYDALDWTLIATLVMSFAALVLSYDGFAGEKEDGTLRLILSGSVPRWYLVAAKLAGTWIVLVLAFLIGVLVQLIILLPGGQLRLDGDLAGRLAMAFLLVALYIAAFVLLGLLISACHARAASALVVILLVWTLLVIVVPHSTVLLAHWLQPIESGDEMEERAAAEARRVVMEYLELHQKPENAWISGHWSPSESLELACSLWMTYDGYYTVWRESQIKQVDMVRRAGWVSPATWLTESLEQISGTGIESYTRFLAAAEQYRSALQEQVRAKYPVDPVNAPGLDDDLVSQVVSVKIDASQLPIIDHSQRPLGNALVATISYGAALLVLAMVLFLATTLAALRYDVR